MLSTEWKKTPFIKKKKVFEKGKAVNIVERRQRLIRIQETKDEEVKCLDFKM